MSDIDDEIAGLDSAGLRRRFADTVMLHERTDHIGRKNRVFGWRHAIAERLIAVGGGERELLPLLEHPESAVRLAAAYAIKPSNPPLFVASLEAIARVGGSAAREALSGLSHLKWEQERGAAASSPPPPDPNWLRILNWQQDNPPPPAMTAERFKDRLSTEFSAGRAHQILALARAAIGLWPQRHAVSASPSASRHGGDLWAPPHWRWPIWEEEPMYFLGQLHCPDLAGLPGSELLPREGLLTFFGDFDVIAGCFPGGDPQQGAVYHWPVEGLAPTAPPLPPTAPPEELTATPLVFRPFIDLPHPSSAILDELELGETEKNLYRVLRDDLRTSGIPEDIANHCDLDSKILGWPDLVQHDFDLPQSGPGAYRQLVQLPARLGPGGSLYFFIRDSDLAQGRFDRCILEEQST